MKAALFAVGCMPMLGVAVRQSIIILLLIIIRISKKLIYINSRLFV